ncbi:MAG: thiolase domain-containing protein, partial [Variovorax sp.]
MTANIHIVGWGHTPFGKHDNADLEQLIRDAVQPALDSAGVAPEDIDGIFVGHFNAGFVGQDFTAALPAVAMPAFRHTPAVRTENACATGSAAIWAALDAMAAGRMKRTLVIGMEKMNGLRTPEVAATLIKCSYVAEEGADP